MILPAPFYKVELIAENGKHSYRTVFAEGGEAIYPGVTGVLNVISKPALVPWAKRVAIESLSNELFALLPDHADPFQDITINRYDVIDAVERAKKRPDQLKDDAAKLGTEAHAYIDKVVKGEPLGPLQDDILEPVSAFADWWKNGDYSFVAGDTKVASRRHRFGGSLDALALRDGRLTLLDWKTSKAIYDEYALQVAAYAYAFNETYGVSVRSAVCVRFRKPGVEGPPFEALEVKDLPASFEAFLAAKHLQEALKQDQFIRPPKQEKPNAPQSPRRKSVVPRAVKICPQTPRHPDDSTRS